MNRNTLYKLLPIAKRDLGLDEETYRAVLVRFGASEKEGRISASTMLDWQLENVLKEFKNKGFKIKSKKKHIPKSPARQQGNITIYSGKDNTTWRAPRLKKIEALWLLLYQDKQAKNLQKKAMEDWCIKVCGCTQLSWATSAQLNTCIEALKKWCNRTKIKYD